jgi:hypothetical protein
MKFCIYTVSDFSEKSSECIDLLYDSLLKKNKLNTFDFYIVTNKNIKNNKYKIIQESINSHYIGWIKYTENLPDGYDFYLYLDSDILFYENVENIFRKKQISIVYEMLPMSNIWFSSSIANYEEKMQMSQLKGVNAGTFCYENKEFIKEINKLIKIEYYTENIYTQAQIEQSTFNYKIFNILKTDKQIINDITSTVSLHANDLVKNKYIYHFCGFNGKMEDKYVRMKKFISKNEKWIETIY